MTQKPLHIYFISDAQKRFVKIGLSNNPTYRLFDLQGGCPLDLQLDLVLDFAADRAGVQRYEDALHQHFAEYWRHREWFDYGPRLKAYVDSWRSGTSIDIPFLPHSAKQSVSRHGVCLPKADFMALLRDRQRA